MKYIRFVWHNLIYSGFYAFVLVIACSILTNIGCNPVSDTDVISIININNGLVIITIYSMIVTACLCWYKTAKNIRNLTNVFVFFLYATLCLALLKDAKLVIKIQYILWYLISYTLCKLCATFLGFKVVEENKKISIFSDETASENMLSSMQKECFNKILDVIELRESGESVNIGLYGEWGRGKTSVIDSVIKQLEKRKKKENKYFILKINASTFEKVANIVDYVGNYFEKLFYQYSIGLSGLFEEITFFSYLADMVDEKKSGAIKSAVYSMLSAHKYVDIETERLLFTDKVQRLLKVSQRKNVILIIDDADRTEVKDKIIAMLSEFSSIKGIITIMLLSDANYVSYRPGKIMSENGDETEKKGIEIDKVDKYIHIRIKIEDDIKIENERVIKDYIIKSNIRNNYKQIYYVNCAKDIKNSIVHYNYGYNTYCNGKDVKDRNVLFDIFLENLRLTDMSFGETLEKLVLDYFNNSEESKVFEKESGKLPENIKHIFNVDNALTWNMYRYFGNEDFQWFNSISSSIMQMMTSMLLLLNGLTNNEKMKALKKGVAKDLIELNNAIIDNLLGRIDDNIMDMNVPYELKNIEFTKTAIMFLGEQLDDVNKKIRDGDFDTVSKLLKQKYTQLSNLLVMVLGLSEFMTYIKQVMNNFRTLKVQLRESMVLNINYLNYLLDDWEISDKVVERVKAMKVQMSFKEDIQISYPSLKIYISNMIYLRYVVGYEENNISDKINASKESIFWMTELEDTSYVVISLKYDNGIEYVVKDMMGNLVLDVSGKLKEQILDEGEQVRLANN